MTDRAELGRWLAAQRWFASPPTPVATGDEGGTGAADDRMPAGAIIDLLEVPLPTVPPLTVAVATTAPGHRYQLLLAPDVLDATATSTEPAEPVDSTDTTGPMTPPVAARPATDAAPADQGRDPDTLDALAHFMACQAGSGPGDQGASIAGGWLDDGPEPGDGPTRPLGVEQSNSSAVVGGTHVLKIYRRLHPGIHPEVEVGRHLAALAAQFPAPVAPLAGWYELQAGSLGDQTTTARSTGPHEATVLGVVQRLVVGAADGWALVLSALAADPGRLLRGLHDLGRAVAVLHDALAQPAPGRAGDDPEAPEAFGQVPLGAARLRSVADDTARAAARLLPHLRHLPDVEDVSGRAGEVAGLAAALAESVGPDAGAAIRHHGDLHLGQTVVGAQGWVILDFEGEPARPLAERRGRHSPLRDVAGMLRSLAYAAASHRLSAGRHLAAGWEPAARAAFLDGYLAMVDPALVPVSAVATRRLLGLFELEKVLYEIGYELAHRPAWLPMPVDGLRTILDETPV